MLTALRQLCAELQNRFAATDALSTIGLADKEIDTLRDLACALVLSRTEMKQPEAPYISEFESQLLAVLGDRQREPRKRAGVPVPAHCDAHMLDHAAKILDGHKLRIPYSSVAFWRTSADPA